MGYKQQDSVQLHAWGSVTAFKRACDTAWQDGIQGRPKRWFSC